MTHREALKKYVDIMSREDEVYFPISMQQQGQVAPACAHLLVGYVRQSLGAGKERGWWQCTTCDAKFIPVGTVGGPLANGQSPQISPATAPGWNG